VLPRLQLFEIHDLGWCPATFRDGLTDFLATSIAVFDSYGPVRKRLLDAIRKSGAERVVDLCSGAGGPWQSWSQTMADLPPVLLTDKFPNHSRALHTPEKGIRYCGQSIDATAVPADLDGFRTIFTAAHHFPPRMVRAIVDDAVKKRQPIGIFEMTHRSVAGVLYTALSALGVWLLTPKMKARHWSKLVFTYALPVIPLLTSFDGMVSALRTYTPKELAAYANAPDYEWQIGTEPARPVPVTYLIGIPKSCEQSATPAPRVRLETYGNPER
jgi:hypothetical protein